MRQAFILPEQKRRQFTSLRDYISESRFLLVKTLQRFAGKAVSFALAVPATKLYVRETNAHISKGIRSSKMVQSSEDLKAELSHGKFLDSWMGIMPWKNEKHLTVRLSSDASNSGWGGVLKTENGSLESRDYWSNDEKSLPMAVKEAKALCNTLISFSNKIWNSRVDALVDNKNLASFWNNEGGRNATLDKEMKSLFEICLKLNMSLSLYYTPTAPMEADAPSRFVSDIDCRLSHSSWKMVDGAYGPHSFDLIAIPSKV